MLVCIPLALFLFLTLMSYDCTIDDAFISFRVARNLARGDGLVFNAGERVEAHSNPLWVLILSVCSMAGFDIVAASKILGLAFGVVTLLVLRQLCRRALDMTEGATFVALCYLAANIGFVFYATSGMETVFYMASLAVMNYLLIERREVSAGFVCAGLALTRPEGILFVVPLALGCYINGCRLRRTSAVLLIPAVAFVMLLSFRLIYYGSLFPNSYNAKIDTATSLISRTQALYRYTWFSKTMHGPVLFLAFIGAIAFVSRKLAPVLASIGVTVFFVWFSKGDWMCFWRFYMPVLPFLVMFWAGIFGFIRPRLAQSLKGRIVLAVFLLPLLVNVWDTVKVVKAPECREELNPAMHAKPHVEAGKYLAGIGSSSDVLVVNEIGAIGYYSDLTVIDMVGLTDRRVPSLLRSGDRGAYADYMMSKHPRFIMLNDRQSPTDTELHPCHAAIYEKMTATGLYRKDREFQLSSFKKLMLFVREERH
jgi:arabinofuranosyltransferase